jgi:hypothetical protein
LQSESLGRGLARFPLDCAPTSVAESRLREADCLELPETHPHHLWLLAETQAAAVLTAIPQPHGIELKLLNSMQ